MLCARRTLLWLLLACCGCYQSVPVEADGDAPDGDVPDAGAPDAGLDAALEEPRDVTVEDPGAHWFVYHRRAVATGGPDELFAFRVGHRRVLSLGETIGDESFGWSFTISGRYARVLQTSSGERRIQIAQLQPTRWEEVFSFPGWLTSTTAGWSPYGRYFQYQGPDGPEVRNTEWPRLFPVADDGTWVYFGALQIQRIEGGAPVTYLATSETRFLLEPMPAIEGGRVPNPTWGGGAMWVALVAGPTSHELWHAVGINGSPGVVAEFDRVVTPFWSPSGDALLAGDRVWRREGTRLARVDPLPPGETLAGTGEERGWLRGDRLVRSRDDGIYLFELRDRSFEETRVHGPGEECIATANEEGDIHIQLGCEDAAGEYRYRVWSERRGTVQVQGLDGLGPTSPTTRVIWAPSGFLALVLDDGVLWELPNLDGELRRIAEDVSWVEWSPDSRAYVYSTSRGGLTAVDVRGETLELEPPSEEYRVVSEGFQRVD